MEHGYGRVTVRTDMLESRSFSIPVTTPVGLQGLDTRLVSRFGDGQSYQSIGFATLRQLLHDRDDRSAGALALWMARWVP
jgi:hypothetical protein